ncbi:MAG: sugar phosphate isomerase/epimerase [Clostridiales bacterium]|jgi:sugar phosphate isomerase/epimerase|nr:sugar phosphate isomerase/epimerase [Clostridiales bacterium]
MIKLGVNSVLFKAVDFATAAKAIKAAGYDGVEISGIKGMCEHLNLDTWKEDKENLKTIAADLDLPFLSTELATQDMERLKVGFEACAEIGIPIVNIGPGGRMNDAATLRASIASLAAIAAEAEKWGITVCCKAHVGAAIYNTETTRAMMSCIDSPAFGVDMDPSHVFRSGENPVEALPQVLSRVKHIHIRDCKAPAPGALGGGPGDPLLNQTCGRGDIDLFGYVKAMVDGGYNGPVCLEIIGPEQSFESAITIAAESRGYLNALLKIAGGR